MIINPYVFGVGSPPSVDYASVVLSDSPLAFWRFGETSGPTAADSSGNSNDAAYQGAFTLDEPGLIVGDDNTCLLLEGGGYVDGLVDTGGVSAVSFEFLIDAVQGTGEQRIYDWQDSTGFFLCRANFPSAGRIEALAQTGGNVTVDVAIDLGIPHHIVVTQSESGELRLYIDGSLAASTSLGSSFSGAGSARRIGSTRNSSSARLSAKIDEFTPYAHELSGARVAAHAEAAGYM